MTFIRLYARVLGLLKPDRAVALALVAANLLVMGLQFAEPVLFGRVVNLLSASTGLSHAATWSRAKLLLAVWAGIGLASIGANVLLATHIERLAHRNRLVVMAGFFGHVMALPASFHRNRQSGRLLKTMLAGADGLFWMWLSLFREHMSTFFAVLILLPLTILLNWQLAIALNALIVVFAGFTMLVIRRTQTAQSQVEDFKSDLAGSVQDALANVLVVQAFTRLGTETSSFRNFTQKIFAKQIPVLNWWAVLSVVTSAASTIAVIVIFMLGTLLHLQGKASIGAIVSFMGFATLLIGRLTGAVGFISRMFMQIPTLAEFFGVLDEESSIVEAPGAPPLAAPHGGVSFERVNFAYTPDIPAVQDLHFNAAPGSVIALVGATGAGKSTAMSLLQRHWDPSSGRILIGGQDISGVTLESLRGAIGVVFQDSLLFNRSIRENLIVGKPDATELEIRRACGKAEALEFIEAQPHKFETVIGERGVSLSGGQRQRLAIARAILKDPPILILDEATSALDAATEARVVKALRALMTGRTSFVIAHRLSTVRDADEILVFEHGRIVERGSFRQLLALNGTFAALVETQLTTAAA